MLSLYNININNNKGMVVLLQFSTLYYTCNLIGDHNLTKEWSFFFVITPNTMYHLPEPFRDLTNRDKQPCRNKLP